MASLWSTSMAEDGVIHPRLLFSNDEIPQIKARSSDLKLKAVRERLIEHANYFLTAPPLKVSLTMRGEPDAPGELKGLEAARRQQGRVITLCMAFTLTGDAKYRDAAVAELDNSLTNWKIWVDTAHTPPYDLMTGEICMTFGLAYDWLYRDLSNEERTRLREGVIKRGLSAYLEAIEKKMWWTTCQHNWNTVCNGGATVLALALSGETDLSAKTLESSVPNMQRYYDHLSDDGGWDEGTGYWTYGNRYAFLSALALRRCGNKFGEKVFALKGVQNSGYFPIVFNPGTKLCASFGDSNSRAADPIFYLLGKEYKNPDFIWFQDRVPLPSNKQEGWPNEALTLLWRPVGEPWLPEAKEPFTPIFDGVYAFSAIGWGMLAAKQPDPPYFLAFKNGTLAANHTHLDLNSIVIGIGDTFILPELGSRPYPGDYFGPKRYSYYEISTRGQSTVMIGGKGQVHGKPGKFSGPIKRGDVEFMTGAADGAYEVETVRARRIVVFAKRRYWVVLDDIATPEPQPIELRFHTYGKVSEAKTGRWTFEQDNVALDVLIATPNLDAQIEKPDGWIKPVNVLSIKAKEAAAHVCATVLYPRKNNEPPCGDATIKQSDKEIVLTLEGSTARFVLTEKGWDVAD
jgi:hypothetical protein